jgi:hypothetical protein
MRRHDRKRRNISGLAASDGALLRHQAQPGNLEVPVAGLDGLGGTAADGGMMSRSDQPARFIAEPLPALALASGRTSVRQVEGAPQADEHRPCE